jgi:biotin-dependent carboxylase-like uncharacterized protein
VSAIAIAAVAGLATVQDLGRPGHMHEGVPPGGALVPELLAFANAAAGNAPEAAGIEVFGAIALVAHVGPITLADDGGRAVRLEEGARFEVPAHPSHRVRYVAIEGGLDVPLVLGSRATLLVARLGGHEGRPLARGDRIAALPPANAARAIDPPALELAAPIRVIAGPDLARFAAGALDVLTSHVFTLATASDRTGARLSGPPIPRADADGGASMPMVAGAIEAPAAGGPIVLGPDHPTTGGYPVIATVVRADLGRFAARKIGAPVRFCLARPV